MYLRAELYCYFCGHGCGEVLVATSGRRHFPIAHDASLSEFATIAGDYPVFRIDPA